MELKTSTRQKYDSRRGQLRNERSSFISQWMDLSQYHLGSRGRFLITDFNKGHERNDKQLNNTSRLAVRTLASGMMAGVTSPARPWFKLITPYPELNDVAAVRDWLYDVETMTREVFAQSNLYNTLHSSYGELSVFGSAAIGVFEDFNNVVRFQNYTAGSYMWAANGKNEIDTQYREFQYTVAQTVKEFGIDNVSNNVKNQWDTGSLNSPVKICHVVEPNDNRDKEIPLAKYKAFKSIYYEIEDGGTVNSGNNKMLRESGFDTFPILAPRWDITGEDVYGTDCPGMISLGDTKSLQLLERRGFQAFDKIANPAMQAPASLRSSINRSGIAAGEITWVGNTADGGIKSLYDYRPDMNAFDIKEAKIEKRIQEAFYTDLFLMLTNSDRRQITAREIAERHEEKLLMLGPVLERLHAELLDPLIDRTFNIMQAAGILPPPPKELTETEVRVEYVSILAQAQRMVSLSGIDQLVTFTGALANLNSSALDKLNTDEAVDEYAESIGVSPRIINDKEEVALIREQRAQKQAQEEQMARAAQSAEVAKNVSQIDTDGNNPIADLIEAQTGV